jgi:transcriptional regulator with XRE-family HTH domain
VDPLWVGRSIRAIRVGKDWTQADLASVAGVSRQFVTDLEAGHAGRATIKRIERVCHAVGAELDVRVRWRGEGLDRLLDEAHADLVALVLELLRACDWEAAVEVTFNDFGDRGSVDVLGWHPTTRSLLIVEVKSVIADAQGTLMPMDRKGRLGRKIAVPFGWDPGTISKLLVVWEGTTNRRRIARAAPVFDAALPMRGRSVRRWLQRPSGHLAGMLFLSDAGGSGPRRRSTGRTRVNPCRSARLTAG